MNEEVTNFIRQSLASGTSPAVMRHQLLTAGWQENVISEAFASLNGSTKTSSLTKKKVLIVIPIILLVLVAISGSIYFFLIKGDPKSADTEESISNEKLKSPQASTSAQLKIYMGKVHKFSFQYPAGLTYKETGDAALGDEATFFETKEGKETPRFLVRAYHTELGNTIGQDFSEFYNMVDNSSKDINNLVVGNQRYTKLKNKSINNFRAFDYKRNSLPIDETNPEVGIGTYVEVGPSIVIFEAGEEERKLLDTISSTVALQ